MTYDHPAPDVPGRLLYDVLYGSHAHGTATENSDEDWRGVYQLPNEAFLGLDVPDRTVTLKPDNVYWELAHYLNLLLKGNPNIVGLLWAPDECVKATSSTMEWLRAERRHFITDAAVSAYLGWVRTELRHGPDKLTPKRLSHVPRLLWEIEGAIDTGDIPVRLEGAPLQMVRDIKTGSVPYDEAIAFSRALLERVASKADAARLPDPPRWLAEGILHAARCADGRDRAAARGIR